MPADFFKDKCLRVDLKPGEVWSEQVDCLQFTLRRPEEQIDDGPMMELGTFNIQKLFQQAFDEVEVPEDIRETVLERYKCHDRM